MLTKSGLAKKCVIGLSVFMCVAMVSYNLTAIEMTLMFHFDVKRTAQQDQNEEYSVVTAAETEKPMVLCDYDRVCSKMRELIGDNINLSVLDHFDRISSQFTKLVFVVSDPRQFVADFVNIEPDGNYTAAVEAHCQRERDNIDFLYENDEWQHRVKVFRIEDIIDTVEVAAQFIELTGSQTNSGSTQHGKHKVDFTNWRSIQFDIVHRTEQLCKDIIQEIGYSMANNKYVFNDVHINLLGANKLDETLQNLGQFNGK